MKKVITMVLFAALATPVLAAPGDQQQRPKRDGARNPERMQQLLDRFDTDGDGKLSQEERQAMRAAREAQGGQRQRPEGQRGQGQRGPMADPAAMFAQADTDGNGQLSQQEFTALMEKIRSARGQRGDRGDRGPRERAPEGRRRPPADRPAAEVE